MWDQLYGFRKLDLSSPYNSGYGLIKYVHVDLFLGFCLPFGSLPAVVCIHNSNKLSYTK